MNEIFKKIQDAAYYAAEHGREDRKNVSIIIASPDAQEDNARLLSFMGGTGVNIIDTLIHAFDSEPKLMEYAKAAIAVVEGMKVVEKLTAAKKKDDIKAGFNDSPCCDNEQPTCTAACDSGEEMGACDGDNCEHCRCDEERGPEPTCGMPEFAAE